ncbi:hypothetical protein BH23ACT2_BH23ACT2_01570 [soil metagenome]
MPRPSPLKIAAAQRGWTLADVARESGYTHGTVGQVSRGVTEPWPKFRARMVELFGFDPFADDSPDVRRLLGERASQGHPPTFADGTLDHVATLTARTP